MRCALLDKRGTANRRCFMRAMAAISKCADEVETLLTDPDTLTNALEQFMIEDPDHFA